MAGKIRGVTIEINADVTGFNDNIKKAESNLKNTNKELKDVNKLLKFNPGNTELLAQKQELLTKAVDDSNQKLKELNALQDQMDAEGVDKSSEQYQALRREIIETESKTENYTNQLDETNAALEQTGSAADQASNGFKDEGNSAEDAGSKTGSFSENAVASMDALNNLQGVLQEASDKLIDFGQKALDAQGQFDDAMDAIQYGTGATNDQMEGLGQVFDDIYASIPVDDMNDLGNAIADINTLTGMTGDDLEDFSTKVAKLGKLSGESSQSIADDAISVSKNFGISYSDALDLMMKSNQSFKISFDDIGKMAESSGQTLTQTMGLSAEEVMGLMGTMQQAGVDGNQAISGLVKAAKNMSADGTASIDGLNAVLQGLQDGTISTADATDIFGAKAGNFIEFLRGSGISTVDDLAKAYEDAGGDISTVSDMYDEMSDAGDAQQVAQQNLQKTLGDIGDTILNSLMPAFQGIADEAQTVSDLWESLGADGQGVILTIGEIVLAATGIVTAILGIQKAVEAFQVVQTMFNSSLMASPIFQVVAIITAIIAALVLLYNNCDGFRKLVDGMASAIGSFFSALPGVVSSVFNAVCGFFSSAWDTISGIWGQVSGFFQGIWDAISKGASAVGSAVSGFFSTAWGVIQSAWSGVTGFFSVIWSGIQSGASAVGSAVSGFFSTAWNGIQGVWSGVTGFFSGIWGGISSGASSLWSGVTGVFSSAIEKIKGLFHFKWSWPKLTLPHFTLTGKFSLKDMTVPHLSVDWYRKAMQQPYLLSGATIFGQSADGRLLGGGEAGREIITSESDYLSRGNTTISNNIVINQQPGEDAKALADRVIDRISFKMRRGMA